MRIGIDATNIGGGGGLTHLKEILSNFNPNENKSIEKIIVFSSQKVLDRIPTCNIIEKLTFTALNKGLIHRILFQLFHFDKEIKIRCDILFSITGDYFGSFKPVVGMSRNMLLYDRQIWKEIKQPKEIIRFWLNFQKQKRSFKRSSGIIFISNYAKEIVSKQISLKSKQIEVIHHGVSPRFNGAVKQQQPISKYSFGKPFKLLYVSTVHVYKHQWNVIEAVGELRKKGYPVQLDLVGGILFTPAGKHLMKAIKKIDPLKIFILYFGHIPYEKIDVFYKTADGIVYASTCENMPNILIESMASGIPITSSNKSPMPEFLKENGFYFDAHRVDSIVETLIKFLNSPKNREINAMNALNEASEYSWAETSKKTFEFLISIYNNNQHV